MTFVPASIWAVFAQRAKWTPALELKSAAPLREPPETSLHVSTGTMDARKLLMLENACGNLPLGTLIAVPGWTTAPTWQSRASLSAVSWWPA